MRAPRRHLLALAGALTLGASAAMAQTMPDMPAMQHPAPSAQTPSQPPAPAQPEHDMSAMSAMPGMAMMEGQLGGYAMMRDASGTAWQPESTPMAGWSWKSGGWTGMTQGFADLVYDRQTGPRGAAKTFSESMLMVMGQRPLGGGTLTLRSMMSLDPAMGPSGYPLLLQTGETANGRDPLIDRQHPHDLFMELAAAYSAPIAKGTSAFVYVGYPGEPALGPPNFMMRFSGQDDPAAPITHHWLDATHITYGVVTGGLVHGGWKLEASAFKGREPDQHRWNLESPKLDSWSGRLSYNPDRHWALQVSYGDIRSPEALEPDVNQRRWTASASYNQPLSNGNWQTTLAWGRNDNRPGNRLNAVLLESAASFGRHTVFGRAEQAQKDELFEAPSAFAGRTFRVSEITTGYVYDLPVAGRLALGFGFQGSLDFVPSAIKSAYGRHPAGYMPFLRLKIR